MALRKKKPVTKKAQATGETAEAPAEGPKEVEPVKKKRKLRYLLLYVAAIGFAFYAVITIINQNVRIAEKRAELSELQQQINVVEIQSKYIEKVRKQFMAIEVGMILEGKVSGITKFGAFVDLPNSKTGMVHISEVAPTFINEIGDFVKVGQTVKVKVLSMNDGKISLSIKQALPKDQQKKQPRGQKQPREQHSAPRQPYKPAPPVTSPGDYEWQSSRKSAPSTFEDMMSRFKQTSEDKMSDLKRGGESRGYSRRGNGNGRR